MNSCENKENMSLSMTRKKQRQNAMQMIYQMEIKKEFEKLDIVNIDKKYDDYKKEITSKNISEIEYLKHIENLLTNFSNEKLSDDFSLLNYLDEDDKIIYEASNSYRTNQDEVSNYNNLEYMQTLISKFIQNRENIDEKIENVLSENWKINRIPKIDLALLRTAITEIEFLQIPYKIAINEALELAKKFSDEKSSGFINGILEDYVKMYLKED